MLVLLLYFSNQNNEVNKWCAIAGFVFWLGIAKEAILFNLIPFIEISFGTPNIQEYFMPVYSVCTWVLYSLAMPTTIVFSMYFNNFDETHPVLMRKMKVLFYIPSLVLSIFFPPLSFRAYQLSSQPFWIAYAVYNLSLGIVYTVFMIRGVRIEMPGQKKTQKKYVRLIALPPVLFWMITVFFTHPFGLTKFFKLWQANAVILSFCIIVFIVIAFKDGVMGLKLSKESYNWNSDMSLINKGAEYTNHMLKNQTAKMEWCIENLKEHYKNPVPNGKTPTEKSTEKSAVKSVEIPEEIPEEFAILSRSVANLKNYTDKIRKHSENVQLVENPCNLIELIESSTLLPNPNMTLVTSVPAGMYWICDKSHMTEVFTNIILNGIEAMQDKDTIEITGEYDKKRSFYLLSFTDYGKGMSEDELNSMFMPYFTTKNTEKNFGLGLAYCKNVVEKHGGTITAKSVPQKGTTITIRFPANKVYASGNGLED